MKFKFKKSVLILALQTSFLATNAFGGFFENMTASLTGTYTKDQIETSADQAFCLYTDSVQRENTINCNLNDTYRLTRNIAKIYGQLKTSDADTVYANNKAAFDLYFSKFQPTVKSKTRGGFSGIQNNDKLPKIDAFVKLQYVTYALGDLHEDISYQVAPYLANKQFPVTYPHINDENGKKTTPDQNEYWKSTLEHRFYFSVDELKTVNNVLVTDKNPTSVTKSLQSRLQSVVDCTNNPKANSCYMEAVMSLDELKTDKDYTSQYTLFQDTLEILSKSNKTARTKSINYKEMRRCFSEARPFTIRYYESGNTFQGKLLKEFGYFY